jgi:pyrophosphate--fructose-6-phosphate 1-phosphotransferase
MISLKTDLEIHRTKFQPILPHLLQELDKVHFNEVDTSLKDPSTAQFFSLLSHKTVIAAVGAARKSSSLRVGVVLSGGQASGGHNVISGLYDALQKIHPESVLFGFLDGPSGIISGKYQKIDQALLASYRNMGGFDLLGSGRTKIETAEQLQASLATVRNLDLDGLVVIGGDDSNTNACILAQYFLNHGCKVHVVGVPKTIDGDLQNEYVSISFGFDSACKVYSEMIGNIARDAISAKKYYHFIKLMGRSASHITLECALATQINYSLLGEEIADRGTTLSQIISDISDMIVKRAEMGKNYGVILIPEGLIEFIPEIKSLIEELNKILAENADVSLNNVISFLSPKSKNCFLSFPESIQKQLILARDPHGNVQLSLIETERLLSECVAKELTTRYEKGSYKGKFLAVQHFLGYEGRAGMPSNFDAHYTYALGFVAALLLRDKLTGYMCFVKNLTKPVCEWTVGGVALMSLMHREIRHGKEKMVIKKTLMSTKEIPFLTYQKHREEWKYHDEYRFPGPIQFFGPDSVTFSVPLTLSLKE